jgi:hypothetical protein
MPHSADNSMMRLRCSTVERKLFIAVRLSDFAAVLAADFGIIIN